MGELLDRQYQYYMKNKLNIDEHYAGQYVVIHDEKVAESFGSERDAYIYCVQHFRMGTFFIQKIEKKDH